MAADATQGLLLALFSTFFVIFVGYLLRSMNVLAPSAQQALGSLVIRVALPSLVFIAMATLDLRTVDWLFLLGLTLAKAAVCIVTVIITLLAERGSATSVARAGIYGIFTTQSNDFALGLPILQSMYPPELIQYLYLVAPISFFLINPIMYGMLELGSIKAGTRSSNKRFGITLTIIFAVIRNPVVASTMLGTIVNFASGGKLPDVIKNPLSIFSSAFAAFALLSLGASMYGRLRTLKGVKLFRALLLICAKTIVLPVLCSVLIGMMCKTTYTTAGGQTYKLNLYGFLLGCFPTAPGVFAFAMEYKVDPEEVGSALVLCTLLAAPLMFVSAKMAILNVNDDTAKQYRDIVFEAGTDMSYMSIVACVVLIALYVGYRRWGTNLDRHVLCLAVACLGFALTESTCQSELGPSGSALRFTAAWYFLFSIRTWTGMLAICLTGELMQSPYIKSFSSSFAYLLGPLLPGVFVSLVWITDSHIQAGSNLQCWFESKNSPLTVSSCILSLTLVVTVVAGVYLIRTNRIGGSDAERERLVEEEEENGGQAQPAIASVAVVETTFSSEDSDDELLEADTSTSSFSPINGGRAVIDRPPPDEEDEDHDHDGSWTRQTSARSSPLDFERPDRGPSNLAYLIFIILAMISIILGLFNSLWTLTASRESGLYIEVLFLDWILVHSHGTLLFLCVGARSKLWAPVWRRVDKFSRKWRHRMYGLEDLERVGQDVVHAVLCDPPIVAALDSAFGELVRNRYYRLKKYQHVLDGLELVSYFVSNRIVNNREEAVAIGRALVSCGVMSHVTKERHFEDDALFYRMDNDRWALVRERCLAVCSDSTLARAETQAGQARRRSSSAAKPTELSVQLSMPGRGSPANRGLTPVTVVDTNSTASLRGQALSNLGYAMDDPRQPEREKLGRRF